MEGKEHTKKNKKKHRMKYIRTFNVCDDDDDDEEHDEEEEEEKNMY